jgi:hypothetical protein
MEHDDIKKLEKLIALCALDTGNGCTLEQGRIVDDFDFRQFDKLVSESMAIIKKYKAIYYV